MAHIRFDQLLSGATFWLLNGEKWEKLPKAIPMTGDAQHPQKRIVNAKSVTNGIVRLRNIAECTLVQTEYLEVAESRVLPFRRRND